MLDHALAYAARGIPVFPLNGKRPYVGTRGLLDASTDPDVIRRMWEKYPGSNIGGRMGAESGWVCIDVDPRNGGAHTFEELIDTHGALPPSPASLTGGGGGHYFFKHPGLGTRIASGTAKLGPGVDVKADGGYVVLPPSIHPESGKAYCWELSSDIADTPLALMPTWMRTRLVESPAEQMAPKLLPKSIGVGERHEKLTSFAGTLRYRGMEVDDIRDHLALYNAKRCAVPCDAAEIDTIAKSVARYAPGEKAPARHVEQSAVKPGPVDPSGAQPGGREPAGETAPARRSAKLDGPALQGLLEEDIPRRLADLGLAVNAVGDWINVATGRLANVHSRLLATEYANHFRRCRQYVSVSYVQEVLEEHERARMLKARSELADKVLGLRGGNEDNLRDWVIAVTGGENPLHVAVMRHWLWQVKRALAHLPIEHQLMPVLLGDQGSGKSTAARKLCGPLKELACIPASGEMLSDKKLAPVLGRYVIGLWDEMEGADKASIEAVKRTITAARAVYRPMATNTSATVDVTMQWIGTSNKALASMFRDATGNRRFVEIRTLPRCNWAGIEKVNYEKLWACVDHEEEAPIAPYLADLGLAQRESVYRDSVTAWLNDEDWGPWTDEEGFNHERRTSFNEIFAREIQCRYFRYCDRAREKSVLSAEQLGVRLRELNWERSRPREGGVRVYAYAPPPAYVAQYSNKDSA